jgi:imidazolonepropionase-like amidohydrolase
MFVALALALSLQQAPPQRPPMILIRDVTIIDGTGAPPKPHYDIFIRGDRIAVLAATGTFAGTLPDSIIEGRDRFAIPGLIDAHVHVANGPLDDRTKTLLKRSLVGGVTSVFDMAGDARALAEIKRGQLDGSIPGPRLQYIALFGGPPFFTDPRVLGASQGYAPGTAPFMRSVDDRTDIRLAMQAAESTGATGVKLYAALDSATATKLIAATKLRTIAHATTFPAKPSDLAHAGVSVLTHTPYLAWEGSPRSTDFPARARGDFRGVAANSKVIADLLDLMKAKGTALNPTLYVFEAQRDSLAALRMEWSNAVTKRAAQKGVRIVSGTDGLAGRDSLPGIHRELELLVAAGLSPLEAIRSATANNAWAVNRPELGTIAAGQVADLLLLAGDPSANISNTRALRVVMQGGVVVRP